MIGLYNSEVNDMTCRHVQNVQKIFAVACDKDIIGKQAVSSFFRNPRTITVGVTEKEKAQTWVE